MSTVEEQIVIKIDGVTYYGKPARVERTSLGYEDHGIPTAWLHCAGAGWGQGAGGFALGGPFTHAYVFGVIDALGVSTWEAVKGTKLMLLYTDENCIGTVEGIKRLVGNEHFLFRSAMDEIEREAKVRGMADDLVAALPALDEASQHFASTGGLLGNTPMNKIDALRQGIRKAFTQ